MIWAVILALFSGVAMAVQGSLNSALGKLIGFLEAALSVHSTATLFLLMILLPSFRQGDLVRMISIPWYLWLGGMVGVFITYSVVATIPRLGVALATAIIIAGQVTTALLNRSSGPFRPGKAALHLGKAAGAGTIDLGGQVDVEFLTNKKLLVIIDKAMAV